MTRSTTRKDLMEFLDHEVMYLENRVLIGSVLYIKTNLTFKIQPWGANATHWDCLRVDVISNTAVLDTAFIGFGDVLERAPDDRPDYTAPLHIWRDQKGEEDWYIAYPKSLEPLVITLIQFIKLWSKTCNSI